MGTGKIELAEAQALAESVLGHITPAMARIAVAGSIRRQKPIVGDIEVVGIPADRGRLLHLLSDIGQHIKPSVPGVVPWTPKVDAKYLRRQPRRVPGDTQELGRHLPHADWVCGRLGWHSPVRVRARMLLEVEADLGGRTNDRLHAHHGSG
jgi:hypothetical protein